MECGGSAGGKAGGEGYLEIVATSVGVEVENLAGKVEAGHQAGLHSFWVDLLSVHTALCDHRCIVVASATEGEFHILEEIE